MKINRCFVIAIQVHDELVLEVDPAVIKEAALLLQTSMENAALLRGMFSVVQMFLLLRTFSFLFYSLVVFQFLCMSN